jgi:hypothetical protein
MNYLNQLTVAASALASLAGLAVGQINTVYTFENVAAGTTITTQYRGVTFSRVNGANITPCVIATETNSASPTRVLRTPVVGQEFSPEFMRMVFTQPQRFVQFALGPSNIFCNAPANRMRVTAFNSGGTQIFTRDYVVNVAGANTLVQIGSETSPFDIARVEVNGTIAGFCPEQGESIDDLTFLPDTTPPVINVTAPADDACVCGNSTVLVQGSVCDPDGVYVGDRLEYSTQPDGPWTLISSSTGALCSGGALYGWNASALPSGHYYLRLTSTNQDGWSTSEVRRIFLDKNPPNIDLRSPASGPPTPIYASTVCLDGSVGNEGCSSPTWSVQWRAGSAGAWNTLSTQTSSVTNDPLGSWNVASLADGPYQLRIVATDQCSQTTELTGRNVIIDNTPPIANISSPLNCEELGGTVIIRGTAFDANISGWALQVVGGNWNSWQTIATGTTNIVNGILGSFSTAAQPQCQYALRLVVNDRAITGCGGGVQSREFITTFDISQPGQCDDIDFNNDGLFPSDDDLISFLRVLAGGSC